NSPFDVTGLSSRAITAELNLRPKPGSTNESSIRFALDYSKEDAANPDLLLLDFSGSGKFDKTKAIALRPVKAPKGIDYRAHFGPASVSAIRGRVAWQHNEAMLIILPPRARSIMARPIR
ncbi:unnamed protein product, partial [marine sediment metagenome]